MSWKSSAFDLGLRCTAALARSPWHRLTAWWVGGLGVLTLWIQGGRRRTGLPAVAREWQRMFPTPKMVPIVESDNDTVIAEIRTGCPLRGTGDVHACHRMMAYDRRMLGTLGGQLTVLNSQSEAGRTHCRIAIRVEGASTTDLVAAHERTSDDKPSSSP